MEHHSLDLVGGIVIPYVNFFIFVGVFIFFFRKPLSKMASDTREKFLSSSRDAQKALDEAKKQFDALNAKFNSLEMELLEFKKQSEKNARDEAANLQSEGEKLAAHIKGETQRIACDELLRAKAELRQEIVAAALKQAESSIASGLSDQDKSQILGKRIADLRAYHI
jgi:F-type H+-transporting ATPase subunit b